MHLTPKLKDGFVHFHKLKLLHMHVSSAGTHSLVHCVYMLSCFSDISEKLSINKQCTKNTSCELQINATMLDTPCDKSRGEWVCTTCCYEDGCNFNAARTITLSGITFPPLWLQIIMCTGVVMWYLQ